LTIEAQRTVGRYEVLQEVGRGGMAVVYLARQTDLDRDVALKELGAFHASDPAFADRFLRESRVAGSLSHPNIVTVHDYFEHEGTPYIAMEYVERGSLRPWVGKMSLAQIAGVLEGLLAGLAHGESRGIVHRDLKPENLMVTGEGSVKIADFGIAKALNQASAGRFLTATGTTVGTPTYMAPEQAMAKDIGPWTDLYSTGVMAYEMLVGQVPFHDTDTPMAILLRHVNEAIPSPRSVKPDLDPALADWLERLLAKAPADRTQSAHVAWDELEEIVLHILGARWRREARLKDEAPVATAEKPLTPAPFHEETGVAAPADEFLTYQAGAPAAPAAPPAAETPTPTPAPVTPPPAPAAPVPDDGFQTFVPGAPAETPAAAEAAPPPVQTPPPAAPVEEDDEFKTYVAPSSAPPPPAPAPPPVATPPPVSEPVATPPPVSEPVAAPPPPAPAPAEPVATPTPEPTPIPPPVQTPPPAPAVEEPVAAEPAADPGFEWSQEGQTIPPQSRPAAGATSFEWPVPGTEGKQRGKGLYIGIAAVLVAVLAAVLGFVMLSGGGEKASSTTPPPPPAPTPQPKPQAPPAPAPELIAQSLALRDQGTAVVASLRFSGGALGSNSVKTADANMSDGRGLAEVRQKGIRTAVSTGSVPGVTFRVRRSGDVLRISVTAKKGAFTKLEARRDATGTALALKLTEKPKPKPKATSPQPQPVRSDNPPPPPSPSSNSNPPPPPSPTASPPPAPPSDQERVDQLRRQRSTPPPPPSPTPQQLCKRLGRC
jgi:hypothetical protein